jgi:hypothetical protein
LLCGGGGGIKTRKRDNFTLNFYTQRVLLEITISKLLKKVSTYVILTDRKPINRNRVLIGEKLYITLVVSLKIFAAISTTKWRFCGNVWTATKLLHVHPYRIAVVPEP